MMMYNDKKETELISILITALENNRIDWTNQEHKKRLETKLYDAIVRFSNRDKKDGLIK